MAKLKRSKRAFRRAAAPRAGMLFVAVPVFLLLCLLLSVAIGLVLGRRAEEGYSAKHFDLSMEPYRAGNKTVPLVDAYLFPAEADPYRYTSRGITDLSFCLRDGDGELPYPIELSAEKEGEGDTEPTEDTLAALVSSIHNAGGRACAYFHVTSFAVEDPYLRELQAAYEVALVNRAARVGVDEILLVGLTVAKENIDAVEAYVSRMSHGAEQALLGVLMAPEIFALSEKDIYLAARVRSVCDFMALDLRLLPADADEIMTDEAAGETASASESREESGGFEACSLLDKMLEENEYYIKAYRLRIVLDDENADLYDALKDAGVENLQIIGN